MKTNSSILSKFTRKAVLLAILAATGVASFATLGDGKVNKEKPKASLLAFKKAAKPGQLSLKNNYSFRGNQVINPEKQQYVNLNTIVTYQQGNMTFVLPMKKKVVLNGKITFNPNAATR